MCNNSEEMLADNTNERRGNFSWMDPVGISIFLKFQIEFSNKRSVCDFGKKHVQLWKLLPSHVSWVISSLSAFCFQKSLSTVFAVLLEANPKQHGLHV